MAVESNPNSMSITNHTVYEPRPETSEPPSVSVFGVGGCGINLVSRFMRPATTKGITDVRYYDTSKANIRNGEDVLIIAGGHGSGKQRDANLTEMQANIAHLSLDDLPVNHVTILVFSAGGGTGSVLSPLLIREMHRKHSRVVALVVADTQSEIDSHNTLATMKTLQNICDKNTIYLPLVLVNNADRGRVMADRVITRSLSDLITILTEPAFEIDRNDRLNWLDPSGSINVKPGLRTLALYQAASHPEDFPDPKLIFESVLSLGVQPETSDPVVYEYSNRVRFRKEGWFSDSARQPMLGVITHSTDAVNTIVKSVEESKELFSTQARNAKPSLTIDGDVDDATGIVL